MAYLEELFSLAGRHALVTGGGSGIGGAIAVALGRAGARVLVTGRRSEPLQATVRQLRAAGGEANWIAGDLGDRDGVVALAEQVADRFGAPDILVNAAGVNPRPPLAELTDQQWDHTMRVNLEAPFVLGQRFGPVMAGRGWGRIINVTSQQAFRAFGNSGAYGASKAGLTGLTRSQAEAWSAHGVCVNAIAPGFVRTAMTEPVFAEPERVAALAKRTMLGRNARVDDFAGTAVYLASDASTYVTGQTLFVDGGLSAT